MARLVTDLTQNFKGNPMTKFFSRAGIAAALLAAAGAASAATTTTTVWAYDNSLTGGVVADSGIYLTTGGAFSVEATGTWQFNPSAAYITDANGLVGDPYTITNATGTYSFNTGSLVGEIGDSGVYFEIGTSYSGVASATGELNLLNWDSDNYNNSGTVSAAITAVPEPANGVLMALGLGAFALTRRRKA